MVVGIPSKVISSEMTQLMGGSDEQDTQYFYSYGIFINYM